MTEDTEPGLQDLKKLVYAVYTNDLKKDYLFNSPFSKYIIISDNSEDLAENVIFYLNNPAEKEKLIKPGYVWANKQTWNLVVDKYYKIWQKK